MSRNVKSDFLIAHLPLYKSVGHSMTSNLGWPSDRMERVGMEFGSGKPEGASQAHPSTSCGTWKI